MFSLSSSSATKIILGRMIPSEFEAAVVMGLGEKARGEEEERQQM